MDVMVDASDYKRMRRSTVPRQGAVGDRSRQATAPTESYAARRRRFFVEADATLRDINAVLDKVERKLTEMRAS
jgi:hypothetical protein